MAANAQQGGTIAWNPGMWADLDGPLANPCVAISVAIGAIVLGGMSVLRFHLGPSWMNTDRKSHLSGVEYRCYDRLSW
jgi:hypothetical protein